MQASNERPVLVDRFLRDAAEVDVDVKIDPNLIGGLVVKIGSRMVDASVRTKLNSIRLSLNEAR